jgi:predicted PolB exonuclease-like 3'-5' exonuclease
MLLNLPGKLGMSGDKVWDAYLDGQLKSIRDYCETDVLNTYLIFLRFELMRGRMDRERYVIECRRVRDVLKSATQPHLQEFLGAWPESSFL